MTRKLPEFEILRWAVLFVASAFQAFGMYHIHARSGITEGGILGLMLLLEHWLHLSPAIWGLLLNAACYFLGWRTLGKRFIVRSAVAALGFSVGYAIFEQFPPLWPEITHHPLLAALVGALFIGIGAGVCVRMGGATCGDDALAMSLARITRLDIQWIYLGSDLTVLLLSLSYLPLKRIIFSLLTVVLSGQIIGMIQKLPAPKTP